MILLDVQMPVAGRVDDRVHELHPAAIVEKPFELNRLFALLAALLHP